MFVGIRVTIFVVSHRAEQIYLSLLTSEQIFPLKEQIKRWSKGWAKMQDTQSCVYSHDLLFILYSKSSNGKGLPLDQRQLYRWP
mgnify:CR=1